MHIFFQNDDNDYHRGLPAKCYFHAIRIIQKKKYIIPKRTQTPGKFKLHIYRTITNTNRKRQIEIYIYTNKQTNKKQRNKLNKSIYIYLFKLIQ